MWPLSTHKPKKSKGRATAAGRGRAGKRRGSAPQSVARGPKPRRGSLVRALSAVLLLPIAAGAFYGLSRSAYPDKLGALVSTKVDSWSQSAGFGLAHVEVTGIVAADLPSIRKALGAERGRSIFAFDCRAARERLMMMDRIADAEVRRLFPGTIRVALTERKPFAVWQHDGALNLIDATGHVIAGVTAQDMDRYPHVVGAGAARHAAALIDTLDRFPDIESRVTAAIRVGDRRWNLRLANGVEIALPADGIDGALAELVRLQKEQGILEREIEAIDMRIKDRWFLRLPGGSTEIQPRQSRST